MKPLLLAACLLPFTASATDLITPEALTSICKATPTNAKLLKNNEQRQQFVICQDIKLVQSVGAWLKETEKKFDSARQEDYGTIEAEVHREILSVRDQIKQTRLVLEKTQLSPTEGIMVKPSSWQVDIDGDQKIDVWEQYFFAIPHRGIQPFEFHPPQNDPTYYQTEYDLEAKFRIDQSDVLWTLAYHHFAEGILELVSGYRVDTKQNRDGDFSKLIYLSDVAAVKRAHTAIGKGFTTSLAMAKSVLAETDDNDEWIPNPNQKNTSFPLPLDAEDFATWQRLLNYVIPAWNGEQLIVAEQKDAGALADLSELCPKGEGLNIAAYFQKPHKYPIEAFMTMNREGLKHLPSGCQKITAKKPSSGLFAYLRDYANRQSQNSNAPGMHFLRHLYWVN